MRLFAVLLHLYPASFRREYSRELTIVFKERRQAARGVAAVLALWGDVVTDTLVNAARAHADILRLDLRHAFRALARVPGFAVTVIAVMACGIGGATAAGAMAYHLLGPLPFPEPERLVKLWQNQEHRGYSRMELSPGNYRDWQAGSTAFEHTGAYYAVSANLLGVGPPQRLDGAAVTSGMFAALGVQAFVGRALGPADDEELGAEPVVLSYGLWQSQFGGDRALVGRSVTLNGVSHVVVGVMPAEFRFPSRETQFWRPARLPPDAYADRTNVFLRVVARLRPGVTIDDARRELSAVAARLEKAFPAENARTGATVVAIGDEVPDRAMLMLVALIGAAGSLLLIAVTSLANLVLSRAMGRRREMAVRAALGAGRERLARQLVTENLLLAMAGGAIGVLLARASGPLVARLIPTTLPIADAPAVGGKVLVLAVLLTAATGLIVGMVPVLRTLRDDHTALREGTRAGEGVGTQRLRSALLLGEITFSVALLITTGLFVRALWNVRAIDPGFRADGVLTLRTSLPLPTYAATEKRVQFYRRVLDDIRALPQVSSAAYISFLPMVMRGGIWPVTVDGAAAEPGSEHMASLRFVTPGFFDTVQIPIRRGRDVSDADTNRAPYVAVVSESFAAEHWPGQSPLGRRLRIGLAERTIVGVVGDVRVRGLEQASEPQVYAAYGQVPDGGLPFYIPKDLAMRTSGPPGDLIPRIRAIIARADPELPVSDVRLLAAVVAAETAPREVQVRVLGLFAAMALVLAGVGIHGLLAYHVSSRVREIGVRVALGARPDDVVRLVAVRAATLSMLGLTAGTAIAWAAGRSLSSVLVGVAATDPVALGASVALVALVVALGTLVPVRRALGIDPLTAIRTE